MSDVRVGPVHDPSNHVSAVTTNGSGGRQAPQQESHPRRRGQPGAEELAVALHEGGRGQLRAHCSIGEDGEALIRIIDHDRDEVVAVVTPDELRELAEQTGLPSGLLVQASS